MADEEKKPITSKELLEKYEPGKLVQAPHPGPSEKKSLFFQPLKKPTPNEGYLVGADYSNLEKHVAAYYAIDPSVIYGQMVSGFTAAAQASAAVSKKLEEELAAALTGDKTVVHDSVLFTMKAPKDADEEKKFAAIVDKMKAAAAAKYGMVGSVTGKFSSKTPNMNSVPKKGVSPMHGPFPPTNDLVLGLTEGTPKYETPEWLLKGAAMKKPSHFTLGTPKVVASQVPTIATFGCTLPYAGSPNVTALQEIVELLNNKLYGHNTKCSIEMNVNFHNQTLDFKATAPMDIEDAIAEFLWKTFDGVLKSSTSYAHLTAELANTLLEAVKALVQNAPWSKAIFEDKKTALVGMLATGFPIYTAPKSLAAAAKELMPITAEDIDAVLEPAKEEEPPLSPRAAMGFGI